MTEPLPRFALFEILSGTGSPQKGKSGSSGARGGPIWGDVSPGGMVCVALIGPTAVGEAMVQFGITYLHPRMHTLYPPTQESLFGRLAQPPDPATRRPQPVIPKRKRIQHIRRPVHPPYHTSRLWVLPRSTPAPVQSMKAAFNPAP